jgi:hypothetical protein
MSSISARSVVGDGPLVKQGAEQDVGGQHIPQIIADGFLGDLPPGGGAAQHALDLVPPLVIQILGEQFPQPWAALTAARIPAMTLPYSSATLAIILVRASRSPRKVPVSGGGAELAAGAVRERGADQ